MRSWPLLRVRWEPHRALPSAGIDQVAKRAVPLNVGPGSKTVAVGTLSVAAHGERMPVRFDVDAGPLEPGDYFFCVCLFREGTDAADVVSPHCDVNKYLFHIEILSPSINT